MFILRPYQSAAVSAFWSFLRGQSGNPVIVLPTGAGKSLVIAQVCHDAVKRFNGKVIVLAHRKELLSQNADKIRRLAPDLDIGIYSAGLRKRDGLEADVCVAGIQSIFKKAYNVGQRHLVLIDEVHLVPRDGEGMYQHFLSELRSANERVRLGGLTATPFRLDCGPLCRPDGIFHKVCYSAPITDLIDGGYLCRLTTKPAAATVDTSKLHLRAGEFVAGETESLFDQATNAACAEIVASTGDRGSVLIFCSGVQHAIHVASVIEQLTTEPCGIVTGETMPLERAGTLEAFATRRLRFLVNVNVLTTGFDAPCIDAIAILRATMSPGLYAQICGRGFRLFSGKANCLILDFGGNIARHGPLDAIDYGRDRGAEKTGEAPVKTCPNCEQEVVIQTRTCPQCGYAWPVKRKEHDSQADTDTPILSEPETWTVEAVSYAVHRKAKDPDAPPTLRLDYQCQPANGDGGNLSAKRISEWVCIEHEGFARRKAERWWAARSILTPPATTVEAHDLAMRGALAWPKTITTRREGRWDRVVSTDLEPKPTEWLDTAELSAEPVGWEEEEIPF